MIMKEIKIIYNEDYTNIGDNIYEKRENNWVTVCTLQYSAGYMRFLSCHCEFLFYTVISVH